MTNRHEGVNMSLDAKHSIGVEPKPAIGVRQSSSATLAGRWEKLLGGPKRLVAMLKAYGDGSSAGGIISVALCVAEASRWDEAGIAWTTTTKRLGVHPFHMTDFLAKERNHARRLEVLKPLMVLINNTAAIGSAGVMNEADYALLPRRITHRLGNQYLMCATTGFALADRWRVENGDQELLAAVFEYGDEGQGLFREAIRIILDAPAAFRQDIGINEVVFVPKGQAGLEMADILAWTTTHWVPEMRLTGGLATEIIAMLTIPLARRYIPKSQMFAIARSNTADKIEELRKKYNYGFGRKQSHRRRQSQ